MPTNLDATAFFADAGRFGLALDTRYGPPQALTFAGPWKIHIPVPQAAWKLSRWIPEVLDDLRETPVYLWRRGGSWMWAPAAWPKGKQSLRVSLEEVLASLGIRPDAVAIRFDASEQNLVAVVLLAWGAVAAGVEDDLFLVPAHGEYCIHFDHDEAAHILCRSQEVLNRISPMFTRIGARDHRR